MAQGAEDCLMLYLFKDTERNLLFILEISSFFAVFSQIGYSNENYRGDAKLALAAELLILSASTYQSSYEQGSEIFTKPMLANLVNAAFK